MRLLPLAGLLVALAACHRAPPPPPPSDALTAETINALRTPADPARIIYAAPATLAKQPVTTGPASPRRR